MNDIRDDWDFDASVLEPSVFRRFLKARGWSESTSARNRKFLFARNIPPDGHSATVEIPTSTEFADYARRVREAIEILSIIEQVSPAELARALHHPSVDILVFRFTGDETRDGTISLDDAIRFRHARRQLLLSAAHSVVEPRAHFPRLARNEPLEFLARCREAPTRSGSFVSELLVSVAPEVARAETEPFARQTTELLARAIGMASDALERGDDEVLLRGVEAGLSSNFLSALADLNPPGGRGALEIDFRWAPARRVPDVPKNRIRIGANLFEPLGEAARVLRDSAEIPGCELEGYVARLQRAPDDPTKPGEVILVAAIEERPGTTKVQMSMPPEAYQLAVDAHARAAMIRVTGTLRRAGRTFALDNPGGLVVLPS